MAKAGPVDYLSNDFQKPTADVWITDVTVKIFFLLSPQESYDTYHMSWKREKQQNEKN